MTSASRKATGAANIAPWEGDARSGWICASALISSSAPTTTAMEPFTPPVMTRRLMRSRVPRSRESAALGLLLPGRRPRRRTALDGSDPLIVRRLRIEGLLIAARLRRVAVFGSSSESPPIVPTVGAICSAAPRTNAPLPPEAIGRGSSTHRALIASATGVLMSRVARAVGLAGRLMSALRIMRRTLRGLRTSSGDLDLIRACGYVLQRCVM